MSDTTATSRERSDLDEPDPEAEGGDWKPIALRAARATLNWKTYNPVTNPYLWFGFLCGLPIPIVFVGLIYFGWLDLSPTHGVFLYLSLWGLVVFQPVLFAFILGVAGRVSISHREQAVRDDLTGLPNRRLLLERLRQAQERAIRWSSGFMVTYLDVDDFKAVNDAMGHQAGNQLLRRVARRLSQTVRGLDTVARVGGDEFVLVSEDLAREPEGQAVMERVSEAFQEPFEVEGRSISMNVSMGGSLHSVTSDNRPEDEYLHELIDQAEWAMRSAKRKSGISWETINQEQVPSSFVGRFRVEKAMENGELTVFYQPIWRVPNDNLAGMEALLRWDHPEEGLLKAGTFIEVLNRGPMTRTIRTFLQDHLSRDFEQWDHELNGLPVGCSINLSPASLLEEDLVDSLWLTPDKGPGIQTLEVTEQGLLTNIEQAGKQLEKLRDAGFQIALDDFGTGYSSLSHLHEWDVDFIKIDRSFVTDLPEDKGARDMVRSILGLCERKQVEVIAEGVEDDPARQFLRKEGCQFSQGFNLGSPMPADEFEELLTEQKPARENS